MILIEPTATWFQTPEAYDFFASQPELFAPFVFAVTSKPESDSGSKDKEKLRGVCVGYVTKEKNALKQFFSRRAIIIGGPALADDCTDEEVEALMITVDGKEFLKKLDLDINRILISMWIHPPRRL